jgi:hypothetical protein
MSCLLPLNKIGSCAHSAIRIKRILIHTDVLYHGTQFISPAVGKVSNSKQLKYFVAFYKHAASLSYLQHEILWHATSHKLFILFKPISIALWFTTTHINMNALICLQVTLLTEWLVTHITKQNRSLKVAVQGPDFWPIPSTYIHTHITAEWPFPSMYALMFLQTTLPTEWLIIHVTAKWPLPTMYALVCLQITVTTEWLITHITAEWLLPSMYALMFLQTALLTDWLITHITAKWPLPTMYALVCMRWCSFRRLCLLNDLLHTLQQNGRSPLCMRWCAFRLL